MEDELASTVLEAVRKDGKVKTVIVDLVCACPNVVTEHWGGERERLATCSASSPGVALNGYER